MRRGGSRLPCREPINRSRAIARRTGSRNCTFATVTVGAAIAAGPLLFTGLAAGDEPQWTYLRPGNTGVMGDESDAIWIDPEGRVHLAAYVPSFEEGGFSRFIPEEDRWENFSNVDHPVMGDPAETGSARISDFALADDGTIWMGTWRGALSFDPAVGADSLTRFDADNSPMPGGRTMDVDIAPDGTIWFASFGGNGGGGLVRHDPTTGDWTTWGFDAQDDGWPGRVLCHAAVVQPKVGGGYLVWVDDSFGRVVWDSDTQMFSLVPDGFAPGTIKSILTNGTDAAGNTWMLRVAAPGQPYALVYRRPDGSFVAPPMPFTVLNELDTFRAKGDGLAVAVIGTEAFSFDGTSWTSHGQWREGSFTYGVDLADDGDVWVSGKQGAARWDSETGSWERHRLTNTGLLDYFPRDLTFSPEGELWVTMNGAAGIGGIGRYDGQRWENHNVATYGRGVDWPFPTDNADAITWRSSRGTVAFNPMSNGIREWTGEEYLTLETGSTSDGLVEDSLGRLWTIGNSFSLRYHDGTQFHDVPIAGWGANVVADPDRPGTVWACANLEVVRTDGSVLFARENVDFPELSPVSDVLTTVVAAPGGIAWVGSTDGLFRVDAESGTYEWFHPSNSKIIGTQITPLAWTPDGRVWFTNFNSPGIEASLMWFDGVTFGSITRAQGLPHAQIADAEVREIPGGYELWLACTSRGLAVLTMTGDTPVPGDVDGDGLVGLSDLLAVLAAWGPCGAGACPADLDGDGIVGLGDLLEVLAAWT